MLPDPFMAWVHLTLNCQPLKFLAHMLSEEFDALNSHNWQNDIRKIEQASSQKELVLHFGKSYRREKRNPDFIAIFWQLTGKIPIDLSECYSSKTTKYIQPSLF